MKSLIRYVLKNEYLLLVGLHVMLGAFLFWKPQSGYFYSLAIFLSGLVSIIKNKNDNHQVLFAMAYVTGAEVLLRMLGGAGYEFAKYAVFVFALLGIFFSGFSKKSWLYLLYILLLVLSLLLTDGLLDLSQSALDLIAFNILGPICLGFLCIYTLEKKINFAQLMHLLSLAALPTLSIATLVFLRNPGIEIIRFVDSNPRFSGMFGPNQVSTVLGMGMCLFFTRAMFCSESRQLFVLNIFLGSFLAYVGLLTFSRGGMITGFCTTVALAAFVFFQSKSYGKWRAKTGLLAFVTCFLAMFVLISYQTDGILLKRYTNRDHLGRTKRDKDGDRRALAAKELNLFIENPLMGVGISKAEDTRKSASGRSYHTHDEITRMLAEHGSLGLIGIMILLLTPAWLFFYRRQHVLLGVFFAFWFLTINHSGMRLVAPAFFYALMLLQVDLAGTTFFSRVIERHPVYQRVLSIRSVSNSI